MNNQNIPVSVLILTLDEADNLPACLSALSWCDDIVVLDSGSNDRTCEIAKGFGASVLTRAFDNFANQRNFGLTDAGLKHEWILHLDADEVMTGDLLEEMESSLNDNRFDAYMIPSKTMFNGKWLRYSGMYPAYQVRLTRRGAFRFKQVGHGQKEDMDPGRIGTLKEPYLHYSFSKGIGEWFEKHNRYSTLEAFETVASLKNGKMDLQRVFSIDPYHRRQALKSLSFRLPFRPFFRFAYMYFFRLGFLDGANGFTYSCLVSVYEFMIALKVKELKRREKGLYL